MAHTCRGTINLSTAHIDTEDSCNIVLSNGGRTYHLKANSEVERQRWVTALELAKAKAIRMRNNQSGTAPEGHSSSGLCSAAQPTQIWIRASLEAVGGLPETKGWTKPCCTHLISAA